MGEQITPIRVVIAGARHTLPESACAACRAMSEFNRLRAESALLARIIAMWRAVPAEGALLPEEKAILAEYEALS